VAIVFKPDGKGASYLATVGPGRWAELGRTQEQPAVKGKR
jgi:hypothetical protein